MEPRVLTILQVTQDEIKLNTESFNEVLDKVGNTPLVIYSISGATRSGKSYVLNSFLKFFEAQKQKQKQSQQKDYEDLHSIVDSEDEDIDNWWDFPLTSSFPSRSGRDRETTGMNIWSEPYFVETDNGPVAVLLIDTQGLFDDKTTARQNAIIFSLTALCSSVTIFNVMRQVNEDLLQQIQYFANYAQVVSQETMDTTFFGVIDESKSTKSTRNLSGKPKEGCFQNLLLLVRDFEIPSYDHGHHGKKKAPPGSRKNFLNDTFHLEQRPVNCPEENSLVRQGILQKYDDVSAYLLPDPGKTFIREDNRPDEDFLDELRLFVEHMVSSENLIKNAVTSGTAFKECVHKLASIIDRSEETFPEVYTLSENAAFMQFTIAKNLALQCYKDKMEDFVTSQRGKDLTEVFFNSFTQAHNKSLDSAVEMYKRQRTFENAKFDGAFERIMKDDILDWFTNLKEQLVSQAQLEAGSCGGSYTDPETNQEIYLGNNLTSWIWEKINEWIVASLKSVWEFVTIKSPDSPDTIAMVSGNMAQCIESTQ